MDDDTNKWACCKYSEAVCCGNSKKNCCPVGFPICDLHHDRCTNVFGASVEALPKAAAFSVPLGSSAYTSSFDVIKGFLIGLGSQLGADDVIGCFSEVYMSFTTVYDALDHAFGGDFMDLLIAGELLGEAFRHASMGYFECSSALDYDWTPLINVATKIEKYPQTYLGELLFTFWSKGNRTTSEFWSMTQAWGDEDWFGVGNHAGKVINSIFFN